MIEPRVEEIFSLVQQVMRESGYEEVLSSGIVLTGGSAVMPGMVELGEDIFLKPVRRGIPKYSGALSDMVAQPRAATVMGLLEEARLARLRGFKVAQKNGSVKTAFGRVKDFRGEFLMIDEGPVDGSRHIGNGKLPPLFTCHGQLHSHVRRNTMAIEMIEEFNQGTQIKVIGVGGGGGNAVEHMIERGVQGVEFICANTDAQALSRSNAEPDLQLGSSGLGAGSKPDKGRERGRSGARNASARPSTARTCCSSPPAWAAAPAPARRR